TRRKADIGGALKHRDAAAAVEADIEFARQAVKLAMLQDRVMQLAAERPRVDQFVRIDSGRRAPGDVAQIVGAGAAGRQAEILDRGEHLQNRFRADLPRLQYDVPRDLTMPAVAEPGD